jgi:uroporphyrinogen decarboxylase
MNENHTEGDLTMQPTPGSRSEVIDREYRVFTYQRVDRVPDVEFGYWPQTIRRWLKEGLPVEMESEKNQMFSGKLDRYFGFEEWDSVRLDLRTFMNPPFAEEVLETKENGHVVMRGTDGVVAERYQNESDDSSIPHFIRFPVETPADWKAMKERFRFDDSARRITEADIAAVRREMATKVVRFHQVGIYGQLRNWMGMENLSYAFYEEPAMVHDMAEHWGELIARQIESLPQDIRIDRVLWWEDMASKNGPLVGPAQFREFLQPAYRRVMQAAKRRGYVLGMVDCDGNPHDLVPNWMEEGVNIMFPLEVTAGVDPFAWRKEFGMDLRLRGGIGKQPLVRGGVAIDRELERIKPLLEQGGYIPHLDHLVPPDISLKNYMDYLDKKRKLIGK